jgi:hypothetical protein
MCGDIFLRRGDTWSFECALRDSAQDDTVSVYLDSNIAFAAIRLVGFGQFFDVAKNTHMDAMDNAV